ncbi:MAG: alpha/beta hydrolase [Candidatus Lustribacter sp.]
MSSPAVLWLLPDGASGASPLAQRLAQDHRVVALAASSTDARAVAAISPQLGEFVLIGQSSGAAAALALARATGESCAALILIAPVLGPLPAAAAAPDMPILLLLGTEDARVPPSAADALCAALPRAHPILIYGAGHALDRERIEAVAAVMCDFIARRDKFIVRDASDLLYP